MSDRQHTFSPNWLCAIIVFIAANAVPLAAQASPPVWMVNQKNVEVEAVRQFKVEPEALSEGTKKHVTLLTAALGSNIEILCEKIETNDKILSGGVAHGEIKVTGCATYIEGVLQSSCKPSEPIVASYLLLIVLHEGKAYVLAQPPFGSPFTVISLGEFCALGEEFELSGALWIEDADGEPEVEKLIHLIQEGFTASQSLIGLFFGEELASIDGSATVELFDGGMFGIMRTFSVLAA